ncbi:MAG TPA: pantoate--beta-alanine ligase [Flavobacteriales bacterium]|jgi:pantoate--beta-alanine ligase|nr:pantoate--beta-alanine ligase [Flavobacteriales bacterium]HJN63300.1 pantoate--beta-alanine ligase [Flavobacteriales bacterium]
MQKFKTKSDLSFYLSSLADPLIGFVPTMGALHNGHLELLRQAKKQCSVVVCSIFVNPTQFSNKEDFNSYPNTLSDDITKLEKINCDVLYVPDVSDLYTIDEKTKHYNLNGLDNVMEGKFRKGHFDGVATIIEKFFNIIRPHKAYFGQKDLQQILVVKSLTKQLNLPIEIISVPTIREENGLAMSSRNKLLSPKQIETASMLYKSLKFCKTNKDKFSITNLKNYIKIQFSEQLEVDLEYLEFVDANNLQNISFFQENNNAICIAAYLGGVRLIDNIIF